MRSAPAIVALALAVAPARAFQPGPARGVLVEGVACRADPTQTYTLYLPSTYTNDREWPVLLVFDPGGRGTRAAEVFKDAAETFGWILASSNNTQSGVGWEVNQRALQAMWPEVHERYAVNRTRIYAAGFSGTVGVAWALGQGTKALAGIIGAGGRIDESVRARPPELAFYNTAGTHDFNYLPAIDIDTAVSATGSPHRFEVFDGGHQWLPPARATEAVGWLEALAMKDGRRPRDAALANRLLANELDAARRAEAEGRPLDALRRYRTVAATFEGIADVGDVGDHIAALEQSRAVKDARRAEERAERDERDTIPRLMGTIAGLFAPQSLVVLGDARRTLDLGALARRAEADTPDGRAAQRLLELAFVQMAYYLPQEFFRDGQFTRAVIALTLASDIHPDDFTVWYNLAAAQSRAGRTDEALAALDRAITLGFTDRAALERDEDFAAVRDTAGFRELLARLGPGL